MAEKIKPRNGCLIYVTEQKVTIEKENGIAPSLELISKVEFDRLTKENKFTNGPFLDSFGDSYGGDYYPWRQVFGVIGAGKDRRVVYTEVHKSMQEEVAAQLAGR